MKHLFTFGGPFLLVGLVLALIGLYGFDGATWGGLCAHEGCGVQFASTPSTAIGLWFAYIAITMGIGMWNTAQTNKGTPSKRLFD